MPKVASDPAVARTLRPESSPGRVNAPSAKPKDTFETLLDTPEAARPRAERANRTDRPRAERNDQARPADDGNPRPEARKAERPDAPAEMNSTKPAAAPNTRQAKNGQLSETGEPATTEAPVAPDATVQTAEEFAILAEAAVVVPEGETDQAEGAETEATATPENTAGTDTGTDTDAIVAAVTTADVPAPVATVLPTVAPVDAPVAPIASAGEAAPADLETAPTAPAAPAAPAVPPADAAAPELPEQPVKADATPAKPAPEAPKAEAAPAKPAPAKPAPAEETQKPAVLAAAVATETPAPKPAKSEEDKPAAVGKPKAEQHGAVRAASNDHAPREAPTPVAEAPAEQPAKPTAQPAHATDRAIPAQSAPAEARADNAQLQLPSPTSIAAISNNAPVVPFHLAAQPILPTISALTALRVDTSADNAVPIAGLAVEIVAKSQDGARRFEIRLDPPELGRIDVRLDVDQTGKVTSRLMVDRAETLDLLRRDAHQLERALSNAGLNTEGGLEFSLRDQSFANRDQQQRDNGNATRLIIPEEEPAAAEAARRGYGRMVGLRGGVDIRV